MDEIPYPARHLLPLELYDRTMEYLDVKPADVMSISRLRLQLRLLRNPQAVGKHMPRLQPATGHRRNAGPAEQLRHQRHLLHQRQLHHPQKRNN